jgi:hypothetical protein
MANDVAGQFYWSNTINFNLVGPTEMVVQDDEWDYCQGCKATVERFVTYKVMNSDGSAAANIPLGEAVDYGTSNCTGGPGGGARPSITIDSCTVADDQPIPNPSGGANNYSGGMWATMPDGTFTDGWSMGADGYTPSGCGFTVNYDHWQLCGLSYYGGTNVGLTHATVTGFYHNNQIGINAGSTQYILPPIPIPSSCAPKSLACPDRIPNGTVFTP